MAEAFGVATGIFTIWDVAQKMITFRNVVKHAPEDWKRYCDGLHGVACVQKVLEHTLKESPRIRSISIEDNEKEHLFVDYINSKLSRVRNDAFTLLDRHNALRQESSSRFLQLFSRSKNSIGFSLNKEQIDGLIKDVEHARAHLHLALTLASIQTSESWQSESSKLLSLIREDMLHHGQILGRLEGGGLQQATLEVERETSSVRSIGCQSVETLRQSASTLSEPSKTSSEPAILEGNIRRDGSSTPRRARYSPRRLIRRKASRPLKPPSVGQSCASADGNYDADTDSFGNDNQSLQATETVESRELGTNSTHDPRYELIIENRQLLQVPIPTDSGDDTPVVGVPTNTDDADRPQNPSTVIRAIEVIESMSDEEWDTATQLPPEELMDFLTSAYSTTYPSDAEMRTDNQPITIDFQLQTSVFVAEGVNVESCRNSDLESLTFCVYRVSVTNDGQTLCVIEPCSAQQGRPACKHVTVEVGDGPVFQSQLPYGIRLASINCRDSYGDEQDHSSDGQSTAILSFAACLRRRPCRHTVVDDAESNQGQCALPARLYALPAAIESTRDDSDTSTERAPSEAGDDVHETEHGQNQEPAAQTSGLFLTLSPDDGDVSNLLKHVILGNASQIPAEVKWDVFVRFLALVHQYGQNLGEKPIEQAKVWVQFFSAPRSLTKDAMPWLWVLWKLQMRLEFKKLSSIIQRQTRTLISYWQDGPGNIYHLQFPKRILDLLDERRMTVLKRVWNAMDSEIAAYRRNFAAAATETLEPRPLPWPWIRIMTSSTSFGYLTLESDRWLTRYNSEENCPEFQGVSFAEVCQRVRSMVDLGDWKVCTVPPADRMPTKLATLSALIPLLGVVLHRDGLHGSLKGGFNGKLAELIAEIEKENWGIDLSQIR